MEGFPPNLILNQVRTKKDIEVGFSIRSACKQYFGIHLHYLGYVVYDQDVSNSIRKRRPLVLENPRSKAAQCVAEIASKMANKHQMAFRFQGEEQMKRIEEQTYYEILEVCPDATSREIQQAYERAKETYQNDSVAVYSLFSEKEMEKIQAVIEEAHRVLMDETSRKNYDQTHLSALNLKWPRSEKLPEAPESPMEKKTYLPFSEISVDLGEGPYRGKMLKQIREKMGIDLKTIFMETRITLKILEVDRRRERWAASGPGLPQGIFKGVCPVPRVRPEKGDRGLSQFLGTRQKEVTC